MEQEIKVGRLVKFHGSWRTYKVSGIYVNGNVNLKDETGEVVALANVRDLEYASSGAQCIYSHYEEM